MTRELVSYMAMQFSISLRQAYWTLLLSSTVYLYQLDLRQDESVILALTEAAE